ncbi:hypothetical protein BH09MYX1_BH09MYX1_37810 [soil metagenome]
MSYTDVGEATSVEIAYFASSAFESFARAPMGTPSIRRFASLRGSDATAFTFAVFTPAAWRDLEALAIRRQFSVAKKHYVAGT